MTPPPIRYFEDVTVGESLPTLSVTLDLTALVTYAGATWDFHKCHYDAGFAASMGQPAPFMDGQMMGALVARQLMQWGGRDAFLRRLGYRHRATVLVGETILLDGAVTATTVEDGRSLVHFRLAVTKPDGRSVADGIAATVELSRREATPP